MVDAHLTKRPGGNPSETIPLIDGKLAFRAANIVLLRVRGPRGAAAGCDVSWPTLILFAGAAWRI